MADVRKLLSDAIRKRGLDMAKVSRAIGKNHAYVQQYISLGKPKKLPEDTRHALAEELGISEEMLREPRSNTDRPVNQPLTTVTDTGQQGEPEEEKIMELVKFLRKLRAGQEDEFDEAVARLFKEKQARPQIVGKAS